MKSDFDFLIKAKHLSKAIKPKMNQFISNLNKNRKKTSAKISNEWLSMLAKCWLSIGRHSSVRCWPGTNEKQGLDNFMPILERQWRHVIKISLLWPRLPEQWQCFIDISIQPGTYWQSNKKMFHPHWLRDVRPTSWNQLHSIGMICQWKTNKSKILLIHQQREPKNYQRWVSVGKWMSSKHYISENCFGNTYLVPSWSTYRLQLEILLHFFFMVNNLYFFGSLSVGKKFSGDHKNLLPSFLSCISKS